jgi:Fuc2NAc and GlcNAc transferase
MFQVWIGLFASLCLGYILEDLWCRALTKPFVLKYFADIPNDRSSHTGIIPRGGGAPFAFAILLGLGGTFMLGDVQLREALFLGCPFLAIGIVGILDDMKGLGALSRLIIQIIASVTLFLSYREAPNSILIALPLTSQTLIGIIWMIFSVATINFYNFSDGINGLVASSTVLVILSFFIFMGVTFERTFDVKWFILLLPVLGAIVAFLYHNVIRKRVFMGDVGSTTLGLLHVFLTLQLFDLMAGQASQLDLSEQFSLVNTVLCFAVLQASWFYIDCTAMLLAKISTGTSLSQPHRLHLYQRLSRLPGMSHTKTTLAVLAVQSLLLLAGTAWIRFVGLEGAYFITAILIACTLAVAYTHRQALLESKRI